MSSYMSGRYFAPVVSLNTVQLVLLAISAIVAGCWVYWLGNSDRQERVSKALFKNEYLRALVALQVVCVLLWRHRKSSPDLKSELAVAGRTLLDWHDGIASGRLGISSPHEAMKHLAENVVLPLLATAALQASPQDQPGMTVKLLERVGQVLTTSNDAQVAATGLCHVGELALLWGGREVFPANITLDNALISGFGP